jgi:hypothetical protein
MPHLIGCQSFYFTDNSIIAVNKFGELLIVTLRILIFHFGRINLHSSFDALKALSKFANL